jgi:hypothetical protein
MNIYNIVFNKYIIQNKNYKKTQFEYKILFLSKKENNKKE